MSNLISFNKMTSMEIAEITGKLHHHIIRDIKDEIEKLEKSGVPTETKFGLSERKDSTGRIIPYYILTKEGVLQLAARYDAVVRAKLIDIAMKNDKPQIPQSFAEALRLAADLEEERQRLLPKAQQYDTFMSAENHQDMNKVAKVLGWGRNTLFKELRGRKILRKDNSPFQEYIDRGYFIAKEKPIAMGEQVINKVQTFVTAKGVDWLAKILNAA